MPNPRLGDVIVRSQTGAVAGASFVIVDPAERLLRGPFASLLEAVIVAHRLTDGDGRVWQAQVDLRGRPLGPPSLLPPLSEMA